MAFQADRTLCNQRCLYRLRRLRRKAAYGEFVGISAAADTAEICGLHHSGGGKIDHEFLTLPDDAIRIPGGSDGNVRHGRMGGQDAGPGHGEDIGVLHGAAGH